MLSQKCADTESYQTLKHSVIKRTLAEDDKMAPNTAIRQEFRDPMQWGYFLIIMKQSGKSFWLRFRVSSLMKLVLCAEKLDNIARKWRGQVYEVAQPSLSMEDVDDEWRNYSNTPQLKAGLNFIKSCCFLASGNMKQ